MPRVKRRRFSEREEVAIRELPATCELLLCERVVKVLNTHPLWEFIDECRDAGLTSAEFDALLESKWLSYVPADAKADLRDAFAGNVADPRLYPCRLAPLPKTS